MSGSVRFLFALIIATATSGAAAQSSEADAGARALAEQAREMERESERQQVRTEEIDVELREAEERLAEAAARIAELSQRRLPAMIDIERRMRISSRPMLGVTLGADDNRGPVEGVTIQGVTPGSAAAESGLRAGDVITAVNDESLSAGTDEAANRKLLDFLEGVEEGDTLDVEYLRDGRNAAVEVKPRTHQGH
ncbi:MAG TPA: PDZ domain-containing protein, partial [Burkholderiales bacterium]|nr:PDZ domain-containing protein [Burkholderiales bacterium]